MSVRVLVSHTTDRLTDRLPRGVVGIDRLETLDRVRIDRGTLHDGNSYLPYDARRQHLVSQSLTCRRRLA